ncbi:MAG: thioredoxin [bacterium]|nr:thioredoxin [bacterium]
MSNALEVNDSNFETEVKNSETPVLVDFWAPWCGPCRKISPIIDDLASEYEGKVKVVKVNTDENMKLTQEFSISGIPSILIFKNGEAVERLVGLMQKSQLVTNLEKYL